MADFCPAAALHHCLLDRIARACDVNAAFGSSASLHQALLHHNVVLFLHMPACHNCRANWLRAILGQTKKLAWAAIFQTFASELDTPKRCQSATILMPYSQIKTEQGWLTDLVLICDETRQQQTLARSTVR